MSHFVAVSDTEIFTLWWISMAVMFVVCIVAAGLLQNILVIGRAIGDNVHTIWTTGKRVANNTVQLWLLGRVNGLVGQIKDSAYRVNNTAGSIANHAQGCNHCPACVSPIGSSGVSESRTGRA